MKFVLIEIQKYEIMQDFYIKNSEKSQIWRNTQYL